MARKGIVSGESNGTGSPLRQRRLRIFSVFNGFDMPFFTLLMLILVFGLVFLLSASHANAYFLQSDSLFYIRKQIGYAVAGVVMMLLVSVVDYHVLHKFAVAIMGLSVVLLVAVLIISDDEIKRWIRVPGVVQFQPSEVAKFGMILLMAHLISLNYRHMETFKKGFLPLFTITMILSGLVLIEPHLSGAILLAAIGMVMMFIGGVRLRYMTATMMVGAAGGGAMIFGLGYELDRIRVWLDPVGTFANNRDEAWQIIQSLYAIGSGGLMGQGIGNSRQKHMFLPEPQNDFIFAIVCEELGFIGALAVIVLFALLLWRGFVIGMKAPDKFGSMLAIGLTAQVGIQVLMNLAVVTNSIPNTGISLPFFSYGGTSLLMFLLQMGVVLSISRQVRRR